MLALFPKVTYIQKHRKPTFSIISRSFDAPLQGTPATIRINLILPESRLVHRDWQSGSALGFQQLWVSRYVFGRSDWCCSTEDMPRMYLCLMSVFRSATYNFKVLTPKFHRKMFLEKSDHLMENFKISLWKDSAAHGFTYSCQVSRKLIKRKWLNCRCIVFITKKGWYLSLSLWLLQWRR